MLRSLLTTAAPGSGAAVCRTGDFELAAKGDAPRIANTIERFYAITITYLLVFYVSETAMLMYDRASSAGSRSLGVEHGRGTDRQRRINGEHTHGHSRGRAPG